MTTIRIPIKEHLSDTTPMDIGAYISNVVGFALSVAAIATFGYLVWGGFNWLTAAGDEKKVEQARHRITNAIIGLAVVALSWALFLVLDTFFGLGIANGKTTL